MANAKLTALAEGTVLASTDILYVVVNPGTSPVSKKATLETVVSAVGTVSVEAVTASGTLTGAALALTGGTIAGGTAILTGDVQVTNITASGTAGTGALTSSGVVSAGNFTTLGTVGIHNALTVHSLVNEGAYSGFGTVGMHGAVTVHSLVDEGALTALGTTGLAAVTTSGLLTAANITTAGTIGAGAITSSALLTGANIHTAGTIGAGTITASGGIHAGGATHYTEINAVGMLTMYGTATVWDDLRVSAATAKGGATPPDFDTWQGGIRLYAFDKAAEQSVHFEVQMPHGWKTASTIYPHVHWVPKAGGAAGQVVCWGLEYAWQNIGGTYAGLGTAFGTAHTPADASLVANKHYLTPLSAAGLSGSGHDLSSMLMCRLFRDATGALATDDLDDDAFLLEFDVHYEMDTIGSNQESTK